MYNCLQNERFGTFHIVSISVQQFFYFRCAFLTFVKLSKFFPEMFGIFGVSRSSIGFTFRFRLTFIDFSVSVVGVLFRCRSSGSRSGCQDVFFRAICDLNLLDGSGPQNSAQTMASSSCASGAVPQRPQKRVKLDGCMRIMDCLLYTSPSPRDS